jgi:hypothetical protein
VNLSDLTAEEYVVVEWQYRLCGGFKTALWDAISKADEGNLIRLAKGFPVEVGGYRRFSREEGWWQRVEAKLHPADAEPSTRPDPH